MMKFRKKRSVVDAVQFDGTPGGAVALFEQLECPGAKFDPDLRDLTRGAILLPLMEDGRVESWVTVPASYYVVRDGDEYYGVSPRAFAANFEPAGDDQ